MSDLSWAEYYGHDFTQIDLDRGVTISGKNGKKVCMYDDQPGLFMSRSGRVVSDEDARECGFDVEGLRRKAKADKEIAEMTASIRTKAVMAEAEIRNRHIEIEDRERDSNPFDVPPQVDVVEPGNPTDFNSKGQPRGTEHYVMDYQGGGNFNVIDRETKSVAIEKVKADVAIAGMYDAEREYVTGDKAAESA